MTINVTKNEYNSLFVEVEGVDIADSTTFRRKRHFWNRATQRSVPARDFTPAKVAENPGLVLAYLAKTGTVVVGTVNIRF